jgi:serine/threonine protein kinase
MAEKVSVETGETVREIHYRGTPGFISPELDRLNGKKEGSKVSVKCDIYAAGCIIREIGVELVANSSEWGQFCNSLTNEDPNSRPTAAEALRNPLFSLLISILASC